MKNIDRPTCDADQTQAIGARGERESGRGIDADPREIDRQAQLKTLVPRKRRIRHEVQHGPACKPERKKKAQPDAHPAMEQGKPSQPKPAEPPDVRTCQRG